MQQQGPFRRCGRTPRGHAELKVWHSASCWRCVSVSVEDENGRLSLLIQGINFVHHWLRIYLSTAPGLQTSGRHGHGCPCLADRLAGPVGPRLRRVNVDPKRAHRDGECHVASEVVSATRLDNTIASCCWHESRAEFWQLLNCQSAYSIPTIIVIDTPAS